MSRYQLLTSFDKSMHLTMMVIQLARYTGIQFCLRYLR